MNISIYKTFAINVESVEQCKDILEEEFSIVFTDHESSYIGLYSKATFLNSSLRLYDNFNKIEDDWAVPSYKMLNTILFVSISHGKKKDRLETTRIISAKLLKLNFQLVSTYESEDK